MSFFDHQIASLQGKPGVLADQAGKVVLAVNVASKCGLTPQYEQLQALQNRFADQSFTVVGFPCNQFLEQEPGTADEIAEFCQVNYGVTFPITEKIEVNGDGRHAVFTDLTAATDAEGVTGDVRWNFEKWLIARDGSIAARFSPMVVPDADEIVSAIEAAL
jgi:glutathione peroxidase